MKRVIQIILAQIGDSDGAEENLYQLQTPHDWKHVGAR